MNEDETFRILARPTFDEIRDLVASLSAAKYPTMKSRIDFVESQGWPIDEYRREYGRRELDE